MFCNHGQMICIAGCDTVFADEDDWYARLDDLRPTLVPWPGRSPAGERPARAVFGGGI
ncbi:hypothetical protein [Streptomyces marianii]|uniref:hypothetical protein n=1 Tax=Streptomyces marianii TaxID=1817406 RepID=UPI001F256B4C|nr:hypothetical protein [Streptomyces marianii]